VFLKPCRSLNRYAYVLQYYRIIAYFFQVLCRVRAIRRKRPDVEIEALVFHQDSSSSSCTGNHHDNRLFKLWTTRSITIFQMAVQRHLENETFQLILVVDLTFSEPKNVLSYYLFGDS